MWRKGLCLLVAFLMLLSMSGCSDLVGIAAFFVLDVIGDDRAEKDEIVAFVCENEEELLGAIEAGDFSAFENQGFINDINTDALVVDFHCGGAGHGPNTAYVGFFYTAYNDMTAVWYVPSSEMIPLGDGYEWLEPDGDNRYYAEHICGNFYYYEQSY